MGLKYIEYNRKTPDPLGGHLDRYENGTLTGVLREKAIFPILMKYAVDISDLNDQQIKNIEDLYYSVGVTTTQDIIINPKDNERYK
jgi:predicted amidohydrolase YtcJ